MVYILIGICLIGVVLFVAFSKKKATQKEQTSIIEGSNIIPWQLQLSDQCQYKENERNVSSWGRSYTD